MCYFHETEIKKKELVIRYVPDKSLKNH